MPDFASFILRLNRLACAALTLALLCGALSAGEEPSDPEKKPPPKPKPFRYSAWCAYRSYKSVEAAVPPEDLDIEKQTNSRPGASNWGGFARRGQWIPVIVELENTTEDESYSGTMQIQLDPVPASAGTGDKPYTTQYVQAYEVKPGAKNRYTFSVLCPEFEISEIVVRIGTKSGDLERFISIKDLDRSRSDLIVVVTDEREQKSNFNFLQPAKNDNDPENSNMPPPRFRDVANLDYHDLADRWYDLRMASLIIIDGAISERLPEKQLLALEAYVQAGGQLLIMSGKNAALLEAEQSGKISLAGLAGIKLAGTTAKLHRLSQSPPYTPPKADWELPVTEVNVLPAKGGGRLVTSTNKENGTVERVNRQVGLGGVTFLPFSLADPQVQTWQGRTEIPLALVDEARAHNALFHYTMAKQSDSPYFNASDALDGKQTANASMENLRAQLDESLVDDTPVETFKKDVVLSFLLLYIMAAVPLNYFLFGWFKRREIAWATVPAWALSFGLIAYYWGYYGQQGKLGINEISVLEIGPGQSEGNSRTFLGLYSPTLRSYDVSFPDEDAAPNHLVSKKMRTQGVADFLPDITVSETGDQMNLRGVKVQNRAVRRFEIAHRTDLGGAVDVKLRRDTRTGRIAIEVKNGSKFTLLEAAVIQRTGNGDLRGVALGNLDAKMTEALVKDEPDGGGGDWTTPDQAFFRRSVSFAKARGAGADRRRMALAGYIEGQMQTYADAVLLAWVDGGLLDMKIKADQQDIEYQSRGFTLVAIPLPLEAQGGRTALTGWTGAWTQEFVLEHGENWHPFKSEHVAPLYSGNRNSGSSYLLFGAPPGVRSVVEPKVKLTFDVSLIRKFDFDSLFKNTNRDYGGTNLPSEAAFRVQVQVQERGPDEQLRWRSVDVDPSDVVLMLGQNATTVTVTFPFDSTMFVEREKIIAQVSANAVMVRPNANDKLKSLQDWLDEPRNTLYLVLRNIELKLEGRISRQ